MLRLVRPRLLLALAGALTALVVAGPAGAVQLGGGCDTGTTTPRNTVASCDGSGRATLDMTRGTMVAYGIDGTVSILPLDRKRPRLPKGSRPQVDRSTGRITLRGDDLAFLLPAGNWSVQIDGSDISFSVSVRAGTCSGFVAGPAGLIGFGGGSYQEWTEAGVSFVVGLGATTRTRR